MKLLFINQFFYPDPAATSQILTDLTRTLAPEDTATVICGSSNYTDDVQDCQEPPPVRVVQVRNRQFGRRIRHRIASYITFVIGAFLQAMRIPRPDVVVTLTTPPFISLVGTLLSHLRGCRHIVWEMDVYPDIATGVGFLSPLTPLMRITSVVANYIHRHADAIIVLGECMKERLIAHGVSPDKIYIAENWANGAEITHLPFPAGSDLLLHYSGNFGLAHDLPTLRDALYGLRSDRRFQFLFAGGGRLNSVLRDFCSANQLENVVFEPYCKRRELGSSLSRAHIGIVTQHPGSLGSVVPSKSYAIMAAGRPLLFIGPAASETARMIRRFDCGWHIEPGDIAGLIAILYRLLHDRREVEQAGIRARAAFEANFDLPIGVARISRVIGSHLSGRAGAQLAAPAKAKVAAGGR